MASVSTAGKTLYFFDGTVWIPVGGGGAPTGASVIYSDSQPDVTNLEVGTIWVDSDAVITGGGSGGGTVIGGPSFQTIVTSPVSASIVAQTSGEILTLISGENISIVNASANNSVTINSTGNYSSVNSISTPDYIQFDTTANTNPVTGLMGWDSVEGTLNLGLSSGKHIHLGEESVFRVRNSTGSTIGKGTALYASGVEPSGRIQVTPYVANGSVREVRFMGLATESISSGVNGFVQHFGYVRDLDTRGTSSTSISVGDETWAAGDLLYVHPTVPGKLTNVKPKHEIVVAIIIIRHQSTGILFVRPTSGGHLEDIHDISLSSLSNEDILIYNSASSIWVNSPIQNIITTASAAAFNSPTLVKTTDTGTVTSTMILDGTITTADISASAITTDKIANNAITNAKIADGNVNRAKIADGAVNSIKIASGSIVDSNIGASAAIAWTKIASSSIVSEIELGYLDGATSAIQTQIDSKLSTSTASSTYILQTSQQGIINSASAAAVTAVLDGAPGALDTLNELAAALNDDASFATTVTNSISEKLSSSTASVTYATITSLASASAAAVAYADGLTTTDVAEGTNLYYTNARGQQTASTMFVHGNHTNLSAQYVSGEIRLTSSAAGGGGATVAYQTTQPDTSALDAGSLWIDSDQEAISGLLPATFTRWIEILSASASLLSGLDDNALSLIYTPGYEKVFINGTLLVRGQDYTATNGTSISLITPAESGDSVEVHIYESFQIADTYTQAAADAKFFPINASRIDRWTKTYSASATTITGVDNYSQSLLYTSGLESVYINGVLVDPSEYTRTSASVITPTEAVLSGDVVDIITPKAFEVANTYTQAQIDAKYNTRTRWTKTFSASATVISGVDDNSLSLLYTAGYEEVYLNGILLTPITDYARTSASVVTLGSAVVTSDIIEIVNTQPFNVADVYTESESDAKYLTQVSASNTYAPVAAGGLVQIVPTSISVTGGSGSVSSTGAISFTSASAISLNGCFSSTYKTYKLLINQTTSTSNVELYYRMRVSGADNSTSNYYGSGYQSIYTTSVGQDFSDNATTSGTLGEVSVDGALLEVTLMNPFETQRTQFFTTNNTANGAKTIFAGGSIALTTSFDSITFYPVSGTITGTITVYGYRN
jgi:hypothetical protein